jgi:RND family efflux transporter MFP subunit
MKKTLFAAALIAACSKQGKVLPTAPPPPAIHVESIAVEARPMPRTLALTGQLIAGQQADVAANAAGQVLHTFVERGDYVKAGATLAQLDLRSAALTAQEAQANVDVATAQQQLADSECTRAQGLFDKGAISKDELDRITSSCKTSATGVDAAKLRVQMASQSMGDATIRAPFDGQIAERWVSLGEYVMPPTRVVTLVQVDPLRLQLSVPEAEVSKIAMGQEVDFAVQAFPGEKFPATVKFIGPSVSSMNRALVIEALVANADKKLHPGMFATASLALPDEASPAVPKTAVRENHVFVVTDGKVKERLVQTGAERDGWVAVTDGLAAGDKVVSNPGADVQDGVPVI